MSTASIQLFGIPFDAKSTHLRGPAQAPQKIRETLNNGSGNWFSECGRDLQEPGLWNDTGDLPLTDDWDDASSQIRQRAADVVQAGAKFLALGGDHSVSFPLIEAVATHCESSRQEPLTIVHLDAHPDLYDNFEGDKFAHACPFARVMESFPRTRLIQIGIRTATQHQREQMERFGVECFPAAQWNIDQLPQPSGAVYLSLDMDVFDPAYAPGVSHHEPGGLSTRDALQIIARLQGQLISADLVEFNPSRDPVEITAAAAAKLTKEMLVALLA
ncbi:MAG: agmatinase [Pirellulales bacterium]|nr:agmatinase [Pirellulales bacterium]